LGLKKTGPQTIKKKILEPICERYTALKTQKDHKKECMQKRRKMLAVKKDNNLLQKKNSRSVIWGSINHIL
jgi:hypothetical protein